MYLPKQTASMWTRDNIRLDADIYYPDAEGKFPVLLMRQPYGREIASTVVYAHPRWYASQGYIVVIQDVRGRGTSQGEFKLFHHEIADGEDTVNWAANLPGSNSKVGMYGFSYQGMTQLYAAVNKPSALITICPAMIGYDLYTDWAYEGGSFCLQTNLAWAIQLATETARLKGDETKYQALLNLSRNLPVNNPEILQTLAPESFYHDWVKSAPNDEYWHKISPHKLLQNVDLPMLHIGGWFDTYLRGTLNLYQAMVSSSREYQYLLIAPWTHLPWGRKVGNFDFGVNAQSSVDELQIKWFNYFLKGEKTGLNFDLPVCLFEMGSNEWLNLPALPKVNQQSYFLASNGLASIREDGGTLEVNQPENQAVDMLVHDPWRPVPALGGHASLPAGVFERSHLDCRADILTYTSQPLTADLHLSGEVVAEIFCSADKPSFDLCAILSEVYPDGRVFNLTQGYIHCPKQPVGAVKIHLQPTCVKIPQSHAVRLSLSAACFPAYTMNSGTGMILHSQQLKEAQIITITVNSGNTTPSQILLPVF